MSSSISTSPGAFVGSLISRMEQTGSALCVGLDPVLERMPEAVRSNGADPLGACIAFSRLVIDSVREHAAAIKIQSACFERFGGGSLYAVTEVCSLAREAGLPVILDAKRGDIGISAEHYAAAAVAQGADAITVNPYLGTETIIPYLDAGLAVFALVRTSNPGSDELQSRILDDGSTVAEAVARSIAQFGTDWDHPSGLCPVGAVVGATKSADAEALRAAMPDQLFLVPGFGAQGGSADDLRAMRRAGSASVADAGVLVTSSRAIIFAGDGGADAVRTAAAEARTQIGNALTG